MARTKTTKSIDLKITEAEEKLRKLKDRCNKAAEELDKLYAEKEVVENQALIAAIKSSSRSRADILEFLESRWP